MSKLDTYLGLVKRLITSLNRAGIDYMFTGAIVASYYDTPLNHEHNPPKATNQNSETKPPSPYKTPKL